MVDYAWTKDIIIKYDLAKKGSLLLSPAYGMLDPQDLIEWMLEDRINARLNIQIHKYIFGPHARGK
jgi:7-carboxy-7-deazaguanine synthase